MDAENSTSSTQTQYNRRKPPLIRGDLIATAIVTSLTVSIIKHTGKTMLSSLVRHPMIMFGLGLSGGYFISKYRKPITAASTHAAQETQEFLVGQKQRLVEFVDESIKHTDEPET